MVSYFSVETTNRSTYYYREVIKYLAEIAAAGFAKSESGETDCKSDRQSYSDEKSLSSSRVWAFSSVLPSWETQQYVEAYWNVALIFRGTLLFWGSTLPTVICTQLDNSPWVSIWLSVFISFRGFSWHLVFRWPIWPAYSTPSLWATTNTY